MNSPTDLRQAEKVINGFLDHGDLSSAIIAGKALLQQLKIDSLAHIARQGIKEIFPSNQLTITGSRLTTHPTLQGSAQSVNMPKSFIFHSEGDSPWVVIDIGRIMKSSEAVYLYNRCHSDEISERILGCNFYVSKDKKDWKTLSLELNSEQIYRHSEISIYPQTNFQFIKIERSTGNAPIHLSQITLGKPLTRIQQAILFLNRVLAEHYALEVSESGDIVERTDPNWSTSFKINSLDEELSLSIRHPGRFSNLAIEVSNAIHFAKRLGIDSVYIPDHEHTKNLFPALTKIHCNHLPVSIRIGSPKGITLQGLFLHTKRQPEIYSDFPGLRTIIHEFRHGCDFVPVEALELFRRTSDLQRRSKSCEL